MTEMNTSPEPGQLAAAEEGFSAESQIIAAPKTAKDARSEVVSLPVGKNRIGKTRTAAVA